MIDLKDEKILEEFKKNAKKNLEEYYTKKYYDEYGWVKSQFYTKLFDADKLYLMYEIIIDNATQIIKKNTTSCIKTKNIFYVGRYASRNLDNDKIKHVNYLGLINSILKLHDSDRRVVSTDFGRRIFSLDKQYLMFIIANKKK